MGDEDELIARLTELLGKGDPPESWIGDDTAVLSAPEGALLLTVDAVVAGVHLDLSLGGLDDLGWKAMTVNLSDVAAMGGKPHRAVVSICAPAGTDIDLLYGGIAEASRAFGCPVVGGDLSNTSGPVVVTVAMTGGAVRPVLRSGARSGDAIFVTDALGASAAGLAALRAGAGPLDPHCQEHLRPVPRLAAGIAAAAAGATAMIDISDGLALDLHRLADASGLGFDLDDVPVHVDATLDQALGGGEDYELLFTAPDPDAVVAAYSHAGLGEPIRVGACTADISLRILNGNALPRTGWQHRF